MTHITVDAAQAKLILSTDESIEIRDPDGKHLGFVRHGFSDEDIEIAKQRADSDEPRFSTEQVLEHLKSLADE